jgi:hypothetical protein
MKKSFDLQKSNNNLPKLFLVLSLLFLLRGKLCISKKQTLFTISIPSVEGSSSSIKTAEIKQEITLVNYYWIFVNQMIFSF